MRSKVATVLVSQKCKACQCGCARETGLTDLCHSPFLENRAFHFVLMPAENLVLVAAPVVNRGAWWLE
jgi:hypothetical protein